jgi:hypothetical protein
MNALTNAPNRVMSVQFHNLSGLAWNVVLLLFAGTWLAAAGYTFYSLFSNFHEMAFLWQMFSTALLATWGIIAGIGTAVAVMGIYGYTKALVTNTYANL